MELKNFAQYIRDKSASQLLHRARKESFQRMLELTPMVPELAREIERARVEAGLSVEELLASLRKERERYVREKYSRKRR